MLHDVIIPFYPSSLQSVTWSGDGELAVATNEHVEVLVPKAVLAGHGHQCSAHRSESQWYHVRLKVNNFTSRDLPFCQPASSLVFSIGEETSTDHVTRLAWSPVGLATHRRSALAVLTANHVLALWEPGADPRDIHSWRRALIINNELRHFIRQSTAVEREESTPQDHHKRSRYRIRAFGWSNAYSATSDDPWGLDLIAVANEYNELYIARIDGPDSLCSRNASIWSLSVLAQVCFKKSSSEDVSSSQHQPSRIKATRSRGSISNLAWSPWSTEAQHRQIALLAFGVDDTLQTQAIEVISPQSPGEEPILSIGGGPRLPHYRPLSRIGMALVKWHTEVVNGLMILAIVMPTEVLVLTFDIDLSTCLRAADGSSELFTPTSIPDVGLRRFELDTWDPVSDVVFCLTSTTQVALLIVTHLSKCKIIELFIPGPAPMSDRSKGSGMPNAILENYLRVLDGHRSNFEIENDIDKMSIVRTWGLAFNPHLRQTVSCITLHPRYLVEYVMPSDEQSIVTFTRSELDVKVDLTSSLEQVGAKLSNESLILVIAHMSESVGDRKVQRTMGQALAHLVEQINHSPYTNTLPVWETKHAPFSGARAASVELSKAILQSSHIRVLQQTLLLSRYLGKLSQDESETESGDGDSNAYPFPDLENLSRSMELAVLRHVVAIVLQVPHTFITQRQSKMLYYTYACLALRLTPVDEHLLTLSEEALQWLQYTEQVDLGPELEYCAAVKSSDPAMLMNQEWTQTYQSESDDELGQTIFEECEICGQRIGWGQFLDARCASGHGFARCSLTFFAIQAPGRSKYCGLCWKESLLNAALNGNSRPSTQTTNTVSFSQNTVENTLSYASSTLATEPVEAQEDIAQEYTLAQLLVVACDICIYCGGKFVG